MAATVARCGSDVQVSRAPSIVLAFGGRSQLDYVTITYHNIPYHTITRIIIVTVLDCLKIGSLPLNSIEMIVDGGKILQQLVAIVTFCYLRNTVNNWIISYIRGKTILSKRFFNNTWGYLLQYPRWLLVTSCAVPLFQFFVFEQSCEIGTMLIRVITLLEDYYLLYWDILG